MIPIILADYEGATLVLSSKVNLYLRCMLTKEAILYKLCYKAYQRIGELTTQQNTLWYTHTQTVRTLIIVKPCYKV